MGDTATGSVPNVCAAFERIALARVVSGGLHRLHDFVGKLGPANPAERSGNHAGLDRIPAGEKDPQQVRRIAQTSQRELRLD